MEEFGSVGFSVEASEGGLKELVSRWFTDTQASHILHDGKFPDWFQSFAARKDAEDLLKDKSLGCFLIRLSDKTIGYILSYKGRDRCRHFVITQDARGQFRMRGGCRTYDSLTELIDFYKFSPIQPFREYLTSSCSQRTDRAEQKMNSSLTHLQVNGGELYDVVGSGSSGVSVLALRGLWDGKHGRPIEPATKPQSQQPSELPIPPPALPQKCKNRKLTGAVSMDTVGLTQVGPKRAQSPRGSTKSDQRKLGGLYPAGTELPEQSLEDKSGASRALKSSADEDPSGGPPHPAAPLKATRSLHHPDWSSSASDPAAEDEEFSTDPLYHTAEGSEVGSGQQGSLNYSEVLQRPTSTRRSEKTCQQVPKGPDQGNTYESVEEMKTKKKSTWGKSNMKWRHFLPDSKKK